MESLKEQLPGLDFKEEIEKNPELEDYIYKECLLYGATFVHPLKREEAPKLDENFSSYFMLCGLPKVDDVKRSKLTVVLSKLFNKLKIDYVQPEDITMLQDESTGLTYGTAFIRCDEEKQAKLASSAIHNFALDKVHTIISTTFDEAERLLRTEEKNLSNLKEISNYLEGVNWREESKESDEFEEPKIVDLLDLYSYTMDPSNDQYLIRENNEIFIRMNKIPNRADIATNSSDFHRSLVGPGCETTIKTKADAQWSPQGRYLVVFQENFIQIYGGSRFEVIREIIHLGVSFALISPCERYIYTYSKTASAEEGNYKFWRIDTGEMLRAFSFDEYTTDKSKPDIFSFSCDGNYCAKLIEDHVAVYECNTMNLLEDEALGKRVSIRIDGIKNFQWCPSKLTGKR